MSSGFFYILPKDSISEIMNNGGFWDIQCFVGFFSFSFHSSQTQRVMAKKRIFVNTFCSSKKLITSSRLFFHNLVHKKGLGANEKVTFFMVCFKIIYFQKSLACIGLFGLFTNQKVPGSNPTMHSAGIF